MLRKKVFVVVSLVIMASMLLTACAPAAPEKIIETVEVILTQIVEVAGTPVVEVVTATPVPEETEELKSVAPEFKAGDTYVAVSGAGEPESLDPAWTYETAGSGTESNIYEGLVWFDREKTGDFVPALATEWTTSEDGLTEVTANSFVSRKVSQANLDQVIVGIRPFHLEVGFEPKPGDTIWTGKVYVYERLGTKGILTINFGSLQFNVITPISMDFEPDQPVQVKVDTDQIMVFDPSTEMNILVD